MKAPLLRHIHAHSQHEVNNLTENVIAAEILIFSQGFFSPLYFSIYYILVLN